MKLYKAALFLVPIMLSSTVTSFARIGGIDSGGGAGIVCEANDSRTVYLADTFDLARAGEMKGMESAYPEEILSAAVTVLDKALPEKTYAHPLDPTQKVTFGWLLAYTRANLDFELVTELPNLGDDHIDPSTLPAGCQKVQIAVQLVGKNIVYKQIKLDGEMTMAERGLLELHETLIAMRNLPGADTTPIRKQVADLLEMSDGAFVKSLVALMREKHERETYPLKPTLAKKFKDRYCRTSTYILSISDLLRLAACNTADDFPLYQELPKRLQPAPVAAAPSVPTHLQCQVTSEVEGGGAAQVGWKKGDAFSIEDVLHASDPISNAYVFRDGNGKVLGADANMQAGRGSISWKDGNDAITLFIGYDRNINIFTGSIQRVNSAGWVSQRFSCL